MRTVIYLGFMAVADAIRKDWLIDKDVIRFGAIVLIIVIIMDVLEWVKNMSKK